MPTSAANARILLRQQKARHEAHPVFTVISLTQVVRAPVVRPVLLIMVIHRTTATLLVFIDNARAPTSSISILVDPLFVHDYFNPHCLGGRRLMFKRRRRIYLVPPGFGVPTSLSKVIAHRYVYKLIQVMTVLQSLLPVSHVACVFPPSEATHTHNNRSYMEQVLIHSLREPDLRVTVINREHTPITALPPTLARALHDVAVGRATLAPQVVASFPTHRKSGPQQGQSPGFSSRRQLYQKLLSNRLHRNNTARESICTIRLKKHTISGIVSASSFNGRLIVRVARRAGSNSVLWQWLHVSATTPRQLWPPHPVLLLPIISIEHILKD